MARHSILFNHRSQPMLVPYLLLLVLLKSSAPTSTYSPDFPNSCVRSVNGEYSVARKRRSSFLEDITRKQNCLLNMPKSEYCQHWRVTAIILLKDDEQEKSKTETIRNFLKSAIEYCDDKSEIIFFTPKDQNEHCLKYEITSEIENDYMQSISAADTVVKTEKAGVVLEKILKQLEYCTEKEQFGPEEAGALFLFTDYKCEELCEGSNIGSMVTDMLFNLTYSTKYVVRMYFLEDLTDSQFDCLKILFAACALQPPPLCSMHIGIDGSDSRTCPLDNKITTVGLILAISIPCVLVTAIAICLAVICIRHRLKKKWFHFWFEHTRKKTCSDDGRSDRKNDYFDIERMREQRVKDLWEIDIDKLEISKELLGKGAFASVYKGKLSECVPLLNIHSHLNVQLEGRHGSTYDVACKKLPNHAEEMSRNDFFHEMEFMKNLGYHLHIISLIGCVTSRFQPLIVVEYAHHGDLLKFIRKNKRSFIANKRASCNVNADMTLTFKDLLSFSWQICDGMVFLCSNRYIHRDLAARNVFLTKNLVAKIGDFGLCREVNSMLYTAQGGRLPIKWMALESLKYYEYSTKSDVWSFAVLLFELFSLGEAPFSTVQPTEMPEYLEAGNRLPRPKHCPEELFTLMEKCWAELPDERPNFVFIRDEITKLLNSHDEQYGYLPIYMGQISEKHDDCSSGDEDYRF